jgi:ankyrin repeat protein
MAEVTQEYLREYIIAAHFDLPKVKAVLAEHPELLNVGFEWSPGDTETGLAAAAHIGNSAIMQFYLMQGAPLTIFAAASLGYARQVHDFLSNEPTLAQARGAHGIPLLYHAAVSGNVDVANELAEVGAAGDAAFALHGAVAYGHYEMAQWLIQHGANADLSAKNYEGKTPLQKATELGFEEVAQLLRESGAKE